MKTEDITDDKRATAKRAALSAAMKESWRRRRKIAKRATKRKGHIPLAALPRKPRKVKRRATSPKPARVTSRDPLVIEVSPGSETVLFVSGVTVRIVATKT